jgi:hypothetical protein
MKKALLLMAVIAAIGSSAWLWRGRAATTDAKILEDRVWIDHLPRTDKDLVNVFIVLTQESIGGFQATSVWRGNHELFRYELHGHELRATYPQTGEQDKIHVRARRCDEHGMDYCLDITGASRGVKHYYSREGWEIGSMKDERAILKSIEPRVLP